MPHQRSRKILIYFFLFLLIGTFNNRNLNNIHFAKVNTVTVTGLDDKDNLELIQSLSFLKKKNLFFFNKYKMTEILNSNNLIEKYSIFKNYPSTLNVKVDKTKFLALISKNGSNFFLGSNGKLIKTANETQSIPYIFGNFKNKSFFELRNAIEQSNFNYNEIKNLFFFKSGRWDIEINSGLLIKLPKDKLKRSLDLVVKILSKDEKKSFKMIDLRQYNQIIINE